MHRFAVHWNNEFVKALSEYRILSLSLRSSQVEIIRLGLNIQAPSFNFYVIAAFMRMKWIRFFLLKNDALFANNFL